MLLLSDFTSLCLSHREEFIVDALYCQPSGLSSVTIELQKEALWLAEARSLFNSVTEDFSDLFI